MRLKDLCLEDGIIIGCGAAMIVAIGIMMFMPTDKSSEQEKKEESSQSENKETKEEPIKPAVDNIYESEKEITTLVNIYDIQHFNIPYLYV